jgi:2-dehydro-3-deoxygluconokinase
MKKVTTFGDIMLRLSPSEKGERLTQATQFRVEPGGSEANVAIALSNLGLSTSFVTKLPDNPLTVKILQHFRQFNVDTSSILLKGNKLGIYWTENGVGPRNSFVIYDRDNTSFSEMKVADFKWESILKDSSWFHFSGISPAISQKVNAVLLDAVSKVKIPYSVDLNYRAKLWNWVNKDSEMINEHMSKLCQNATLIAGNENDFQNIFGINTYSSSKKAGFDEIVDLCFKKFPKLNFISISNREAISASTNFWNGFLFVKENKITKYIGRKYKLESIVDRVGTGDSFVAGIIFGLLNKELFSYQKIIDFASTLSALNHTTIGDASCFSTKEVWKVIEDNGAGRIIR